MITICPHCGKISGDPEEVARYKFFNNDPDLKKLDKRVYYNYDWCSDCNGNLFTVKFRELSNFGSLKNSEYNYYKAMETLSRRKLYLVFNGVEDEAYKIIEAHKNLLGLMHKKYKKYSIVSALFEVKNPNFYKDKSLGFQFLVSELKTLYKSAPYLSKNDKFFRDKFWKENKLLYEKEKLK